MRWVDALKIWNAEKGGAWCVPKKGSAEHAEVMKIIASKKLKSEAKPETAPPMAKKIKPKIKVSGPDVDLDKLGMSMEKKKKERVAKFLLALAKKRKQEKIFTPSQIEAFDTLKKIGLKRLENLRKNEERYQAFMKEQKKQEEAEAKRKADEKLVLSIYKEKQAEKRKKLKQLPEYAVEEHLRDIMKEYLIDQGEDEDRAEERIENDFADVLEDLGGGYGMFDFDDVIEDIYVRMLKRGYKKKEILEGMDAQKEDGYTMYEDFVSDIRSKKRKAPKLILTI